jgi:CRP/FNR family cyclic AMP-dependent transcriptional regulator
MGVEPGRRGAARGNRAGGNAHTRKALALSLTLALTWPAGHPLGCKNDVDNLSGSVHSEFESWWADAAGNNAVTRVDQDRFDPKAFIATIGAGKSNQRVRRNERVFAQGETADSVFYIQEGRVKLIVTSSHGKEAVVGILHAGQFFGEGCLGNHPLRMATAIAMEDSVITAIRKSDMMTALHDEPRFSELFTAYLLSRNNRIEADLIDHLFNSSEKRLARLLLLLANFGDEGSPQPIELQISQETLAEMIGTTRSRVSFFMNRFRKQGYISYNGKIKVHSSLLHVVLQEKLEFDEAPAG